MQVYLHFPSIAVGGYIGGPADLSAAAGPNAVIYLVGDATPEDHGRWASALGRAALRGATIQKGHAR